MKTFHLKKIDNRIIFIATLSLVISVLLVSAYPFALHLAFRVPRSSVTTSIHIELIRLLVAYPFVYCVLALFTFGTKTVGQWLHKYRWYIGVTVIAFAVIANISGSSLGAWNSFLGQNALQDVVYGVPRGIRSDEYMVNTTLAFSQHYNHYQFWNDLVGNTSSNMFIIKDAPVWSIGEIFRPFHWGYLLLGSTRGLAFYWFARLVLLFLTSYEFFLRLSSKNREIPNFIALLGAVLLTFSPLIQWWYAVNGLPEMIIAICVSVICFEELLTNKSIITSLLSSAVIFICAGMFIFTLYPAWQLPLGYILF
ncbi:MAG: hypothetical protein Q3961_05130, partial [Bifidobacteriaceae bacterium]|nr:hypothetical protein [Bifidobacteriaceae bacterium]